MKGLLFTYGVAYGGAVAALINPFYGLLAYVCFAVLRPEALWFWSVPPGQNFSRILAIAMLLGWAARGFGNWNLGRATGAVWALLGYLVWAAMSAALAPNATVGWGFVEALAKIVLPVLVGVTTITSLKQVRQLAWVITLSQGYVAFDLNMSYFSGFNRLQMVGFGGMDNNSYAIALVTGIGFAFFLGLEERAWWRKLIAFGAAAFMAHAVFFSFSRGGMLALIVTGVVSFLLIEKRPKHYVWFAVGIMLALTMAGKEVRERFSTAFLDEEVRDYSATSRLDLWRDCLDVMTKNPLFGAGPNHWPLIASDYGWPKGKEAHSVWFQQGAELGFVGVGLLAAYYLLSMRQLRRLSRKNRPLAAPWHRGLARAVIASTAGYLVASQFVSLEGLEVPYYVVMCGLAGLVVESRAAAAAQRAADPRTRPGDVVYAPLRFSGGAG